MAQKLRVGIAGAFGTNKGEIARRIAKALDTVSIETPIEPVMDDCGITHLTSLFDDKNKAITFQTALLREQAKLEDQCRGSFISAGTIFDILAYWHLYGADESVEYEELASQFVWERRNKYTDIIFVPTENVFSVSMTKGITCPGCRYLLSNLIWSIILDYDMGWQTLVTSKGNINEQVNQILQYLKGR